MEPRRLVWVRTGEPGGSGSGYLIGPRLVLTSLHVVRVLPTAGGEGRWVGRVEAEVGHKEFGGAVHRTARVCWPDPARGVPPEDALDVALLRLDEPVTTAGDDPVRWGRPAGVGRIPFKGAGFPAFASGTGRAGDVEDLHGELPPIGTSLTGWVLDTPVKPATGGSRERPWDGVSGSAVFCHGHLVGVAVEDSRALDWGRLYAVPVHEVLSLPAFAALVTDEGFAGTTTEAETVTAEGTPGPGQDPAATPLEVGPVPTLASAFQPREHLRARIDRARAGGSPVVLTQVLSGGGGVGKSQLAAACATDALADGTHLVLWTSATETQQVITQYAQAARDLRLTGAAGDDPEADARILLKWLGSTRRRWLVVLDDITDPTALTSWWPVSRTGTGWVLATTRLDDARLTGGGRVQIDIDVYAPAEALGYLRERLTAAHRGHLLDDQAPALVEALGRLPLALGLAAAHMINEDLGCSAYARLFADRRTPLDQALPETADSEAYGRPITTALLLSLDAVTASDATGLAIPALRLIALLDPAGHPHALWTTDPLLAHLTAHADSAGPVTPDQARSLLRLLHRYALVISDSRAEPRAVRIHALTARAVREATPDTDLPGLAHAAADALLSVWPEVDLPRAVLAAALRTNAETLTEHTGDHLWHPAGHLVHYRTGGSLLDAGLPGAAAHWERIAGTADRILGADHADTLAAYLGLAASFSQEGRTDEAIALEERILARREHLLGHDHPDTLATRNNLAASYWQAGRTEEAITLEEQLVIDAERVLGPEHPNTLTTRNGLATSYRQAGRTDEAIALQTQVLADRERILGHDHPQTLTTRHNLAASYWHAGRTDEAVALQEQVLVDRERVLGHDHPDTLNTRRGLARMREGNGTAGGKPAQSQERAGESTRPSTPEATT